MSESKVNTVEQLEQLISQRVQQALNQQGQQQGQAAQTAQANNFGLPQQQMMMQPGMQPVGAMPMGPVPQPTGVSVPVTVPLPDGRELSVRVHFGAEAAGNLQQLAAMCAQMFGPYLQARNPWRGNGGYGSWNGRSRSNYGRRY